MAARKRKVELSENWRDKISASMLMNRLKEHIDGDVELSSTQLKAVELILQRTVASLSSVETTVHNAEDALTEEQLIDRYSAVFDARPDLLTAIQARKARANPLAAPQQSVQSDQQDPTERTGTE